MPDPSGPVTYIVIGCLLILSAFFAACESAFASCNKHRIITLADDGNKRAKVALKIINRFDSTIITTLIAINVCHISLSVIATILMVNLYGSAMGPVLSTIITTVVVFLFCEVIPKNFASANADSFAINTAVILYFFKIIFFPVSIIFQTLLKGTKIAFNLEEDEDEFDEDDFQDVVEKVEEEGIIDEDESEIIKAAIDFGDTKIKEVFTPRNKIVAIDINKCNEEFIHDFILKNTYSRIPVYDGSLDRIVGILHVRTYLKELIIHKNTSIKESLMPVYFVSPSAKIDDIFEGLSKHQTHIAIVRQKGKVIGMVTMKDILEELVEDIEDKSDTQRGEVL